MRTFSSDSIIARRRSSGFVILELFTFVMLSPIDRCSFRGLFGVMRTMDTPYPSFAFAEMPKYSWGCLNLRIRCFS